MKTGFWVSVLIGAVLSGCIQQAPRDPFGLVGRHYSSAVSLWGQPDSVSPDGAGGTVLSWRGDPRYGAYGDPGRPNPYAPQDSYYRSGYAYSAPPDGYSRRDPYAAEGLPDRYVPPRDPAYRNPYGNDPVYGYRDPHNVPRGDASFRRVWVDRGGIIRNVEVL